MSLLLNARMFPKVASEISILTPVANLWRVLSVIGVSLLAVQSTPAFAINPIPEGGSRSVAIVRVASTDGSVDSMWCNRQQLEDMYFNASDSITRFYEVSTYGQRTFTKDRDGDGQADIFDVSVNFPTANTCDYIRVARDIIPLLAARGINLSDWNIVMLILPSNTRCAFAGASWGEDNQDGQTSWATIDGRYCYAKKTAAHELGHTMAMGHADYDFGDDSASTTEYGDSQCIMGNVGSYVQFNAPHRVLKGWVPQNKILQLEHSGSYTISSLDRDPSSSALPSVLTFPRYDGAMYYISYREPGPFNALPYSEDFVNLHYATDSRSHTYLIESFNIPGKSYTTRTGPEVKVESLGDGTATVTVTGCIRHAPSFGISPSTLRTKPKSAYQYSFTLFNRDSVECAPRSFEFTCESDLAFLCSSTFDTPPVLSPGGAASGTLTLTPQSLVPDGIYQHTIRHSGIGGSFTRTIRTEIDSLAPNPPTNLTARVQSRGRVSLRWRPPADKKSGIRSYRIFRDGQLRAETRARSYRDSTAVRGQTHQYEIFTVDRVGNVSPEGAALMVSIPVGFSG